MPSIQARTRQYANIIKASPAYTAEQGEHYGIIGAAGGGPTTPELSPLALTSSQVQIGVTKSDFSLVAIDSKRGTGDWEQIGVSQTATYIDTRGPLAAGAPEIREYRAQGMDNNVRVGARSAIVSVVTVP